jgi:hypothetical protein
LILRKKGILIGQIIHLFDEVRSERDVYKAIYMNLGASGHNKYFIRVLRSEVSTNDNRNDSSGMIIGIFIRGQLRYSYFSEMKAEKVSNGNLLTRDYFTRGAGTRGLVHRNVISANNIIYEILVKRQRQRISEREAGGAEPILEGPDSTLRLTSMAAGAAPLYLNAKRIETILHGDKSGFSVSANILNKQLVTLVDVNDINYITRNGITGAILELDYTLVAYTIFDRDNIWLFNTTSTADKKYIHVQ